MSAQELKSIHPFSLTSLFKIYSYKDSCILEELNYEDLLRISSRFDYVWIHFYTPWCTETSCTNLQQYIDFSEKFSGKLHLVLISSSYDKLRLCSNKPVYPEFLMF